MNCQLCEKEFEAYLQNRLSPGLRSQVEKHLDGCGSCTEKLFLGKLAASYIQAEKMKVPDTALSENIMKWVANESRQEGRIIIMQSAFWRNFIYAASVAAAVFAGVMAGNIYKPAGDNSVPVEISYMDDEQLEAVNLFLDEN